MLKPEDDPNAGSKHVAYLIQPYIIKDSCARRNKFLPLQFYSECSETRCLIVISGFRLEVAKICAILGYYAVNSGKKAISGNLFPLLAS